MKHRWVVVLISLLLVGPAVLIVSAADPPDAGVTLIGTGVIPGNALDLSGLEGLSICQLGGPSCIDRATLGGLGSALAYTGHDDVFVAVPDRGPFDGRTDVPYRDRFHFLHMTVDVGASFPNITATLLDSRFLNGEGNKPFVGDAFAFSDGHPLATMRLDPEGVTVAGDGTFYLSDEYGPYILNFNRQGHLVRRIPVPQKFLLDLFDEDPTGHQSGEIDSDGNSLELYSDFNTTGRQANRGMEGLTITPDGRTLVGIMQNALLQDNALMFDVVTGLPARVGFNNRILTYDLQTGATHEYVYPMEAVNQGRGVNEILAINNHEFLVLERDNRTLVPTPPAGANSPSLKSIFKIDLQQAGLTDVSTTPSLPKTRTELAALLVVPVTKNVVINMLNSNYVVSSSPLKTIKDVIAEKVEGMAWGPDLPDGRHVLYVTTDNDLYTGYLPSHPDPLPTQIYAFAIDGAAAHIDYQPTPPPEPLFPPGQVKKALQR